MMVKCAIMENGSKDWLTNLADLMGQVLGLTVVFNPWLFLAIFVMTLVAEFGVSVPLLMESVWLFTGYTFASGHISAEQLVMFMAVGLVGRLLGGITVFYLAWYGQKFVGVPIFRFLKNRMSMMSTRYRPVRCVHRIARWVSSKAGNGAVTDNGGIRILGRRFRLSAFTVACGRLVGLRWPITLFLGAKRQRTKLLLGIAIFSVIWDAAYILFGVLGGKSGLNQTQMVFYPLGAVVLIAALVFGFKRLRSFLRSRRPLGTGASTALCCPLPNIPQRYPLAQRTPDPVLYPDNT